MQQAQAADADHIAPAPPARPKAAGKPWFVRWEGRRGVGHGLSVCAGFPCSDACITYAANGLISCAAPNWVSSVVYAKLARLMFYLWCMRCKSRPNCTKFKFSFGVFTWMPATQTGRRRLVHTSGRHHGSCHARRVCLLELGTVRRKNQVNALVKILVGLSCPPVVLCGGLRSGYGTHFFVRRRRTWLTKNGYELVKFFFC